jgi:creatinine amidohydrolase/Fe(II)-dependent formamide hydrolase-like protein
MTFSARNTVLVLLPAAIAAFGVAQAQEPGPGRQGKGQNGKATASVNTQDRVDVLKMARPIEMHDTVWIEDMTSIEIRDSLKAGKTTAIILAGGMEENGPYLTMGKHNNVMRAQGESIARRLGNALCAPIITMEPGNPEKSASPGSVVISEAAYEMVLTDMANSLRAQGFKDIIYLGDHGGDQRGINTVSKTLNEKWKGTGVNTWYVADFYDYAGVEKYEQDVLGIHEKMEGYHDDYYISSIIMTVDVNGVRLPERRKAKKTSINGVDLDPAAKTIENGKKIVEYRTDVTVKALQKMMAEAKSTTQQ